MTFRFKTDATAVPDELAAFDRLVIATGADYRFNLGPLARTLLERGGGRWPVLRKLLSPSGLRGWFYYNARMGTCARALFDNTEPFDGVDRRAG